MTLPHRRAVAFYGASEEKEAIPWLSTGEAALREVGALRRRAADAHRNDPLIANGIRIMRSGLVANPYPVSQNADATEAFSEWARACGHKHNHGSFASIQRMVAQHLVQDGECFVQRVWTQSNRVRNGMLLAVWPKRLVDRSRGHNWTGQEYEDGVWQGTWFQSLTVEPGYQRYEPVLVPARDLIWVRYVCEGDHVEGLPWMHASLESAAQLADFAQTALVQQRVAACLAAMVIAKDSIFATSIEAGPTIKDAEGNEIVDLEPGSIPIVHGAEDVKVISPQMANGFSVDHHTARVAAGFGLTSEIISGSMGQASFSAARHALLVRDEVTDDLAIDFEPFRTTVIEWWREAEQLRGFDWSDAQFEFLSRRAPSVDPEKTARADEIELRMGSKSLRQIIAERGRDPEQVFAEVREERANGFFAE